mmetsp:Transcript_24427/g.35905  ORF Transcript_24427/g.35905 Transcript_24427/m.35905 type:complete len:97 (-) Transcript_24427:321-611(-)
MGEGVAVPPLRSADEADAERKDRLLDMVRIEGVHATSLECGSGGCTPWCHVDTINLNTVGGVFINAVWSLNLSSGGLGEWLHVSISKAQKLTSTGC